MPGAARPRNGAGEARNARIKRRGAPLLQVTSRRRSLRRAATACAASLAIACAASASAATPAPGRRLGEGQPGLGRTRRGEARADRRARAAGASRTASSSCATASSRASGTSAATGPNTPQDVFSATKSVASTLVGHRPGRRRPAHRRERVDVDPAVEGHEGRGRHGARPAEHGLGPRVELRSPTTCACSPRPTARPSRSASARQRRRERVWAYNNSAVQTLDRVLAQATGEDVAAFAERRLLRAAGHGPHHRSAPTGPAMRSCSRACESTCRDMARFGVLMLNRGRWGGQQTRLAGLGRRRRPAGRRRSSTPPTATSGGSIARASSRA